MPKDLMDKTREAAIEQAWKESELRVLEQVEALTDDDLKAATIARIGFAAGAASVDRVEVVREAFERAFDLWTPQGMRHAMDRVLAAMEKGK